jgi:hypothetical protein
MIHTGSLGGRPSFITEYTFTDVSHMTKIALSLFKMEDNHLEIFIHLKYKSPSCTSLMWSVGGCTLLMWSVGGCTLLMWSLGGYTLLMRSLGCSTLLMWSLGGRISLMWCLGSCTLLMWSLSGRTLLIRSLRGCTRKCSVVISKDKILKNIALGNACMVTKQSDLGYPKVCFVIDISPVNIGNERWPRCIGNERWARCIGNERWARCIGNEIWARCIQAC